MISAFRPVFAACLLTVTATPVDAKAKAEKAAARPAAPSACSDFCSGINADRLPPR